jgi:hypothetical protein
MQPCMFENKLQVSSSIKNIPNHKFGMLNFLSLSRKKTLKALNLHICVK